KFGSKPSAGFHACTAPVTGLRAATAVRGAPPIVVNFPPTYNTPFARASAVTIRGAVGSGPGRGAKEGSTLPSLRMCTRSPRLRPPAVVSVPPTNQPPAPSETIAVTVPPIRGNGAPAAPVEGSSDTAWPVAGPS